MKGQTHAPVAALAVLCLLGSRPAQGAPTPAEPRATQTTH
jgi:hypothetical protein